MPREIHLNFYRCPRCWLEWDDRWCSTCNDRCPNCHLESSPIAHFPTGFVCDHTDC